MAYQVSNEYNEIIYSGDTRHKLKIFIGIDEVELQDADLYCESLRKKGRIIPNGNKGFYLDNFVSQELECVFHDIDISTIVEPIKISIGTLINNAYEYVPLGKFNIQNKQKSDRNRIIVKLLDNAIKFDFNYNAKPLIDENNGIATKKQILDDICEQAGITTKVTTFDGENDEIGIYDNTIKARKYICYIAEQAGGIPTIDRDGDLIFVYLNQSTIQQIPLSAIEKYKIGDTFKIGRVVYEDGIRKYEKHSADIQTEWDDTMGNTLYLDTANPYISSQEQIDTIYDKVNNFEISSIKTGKIYGNPAIDSYDLIEIVDDYQLTRPVIAKTLATYDLIYNGVITTTYNTTIEQGDTKENITLRETPQTVKRYAKTEIDNVNAIITLQAGQIQENQTNTSQNTSSIAALNISNSNIENSVSTNHQNIIDSQAQLETLETVVSQNNTSVTTTITQLQQEINKDVTTLKNELVTINIDGINVSTNVSPIATLMANDKFVIRSGDKYLSYIGYDEDSQTTIARMDNLKVTTYLSYGYHRAEKVDYGVKKRTVYFFIGE